MRKFLGTLVIFVIIVAGVGYARGWITVSKDDQPDETKVEVKIDKTRVKEDADEVARKAREIREEVGQQIHEREDGNGTTEGESEP